MKRLLKLMIMISIVSTIAAKIFAQTNENQKVPDWATAYADDALHHRINEINEELMTFLGSLCKEPAKVDTIIWSNPDKLAAFKRNPNCIACVVTANGITYMFLNEKFKYIDNNKADYDSILAHELLHLYVGHDIDHGDLWQTLASYITRNSRFVITETYCF